MSLITATDWRDLEFTMPSPATLPESIGDG